MHFNVSCRIIYISSETFGCSKLAIYDVPFSQVCILSFIWEVTPSHILKFSPVNRPCIISKFAFIDIWLQNNLNKICSLCTHTSQKIKLYWAYGWFALKNWLALQFQDFCLKILIFKMAFKRDILGFMEWYKNLELSVLWWPPTRFDYSMIFILDIYATVDYWTSSYKFDFRVKYGHSFTGPPPCPVPKWKRANNYCNCSSCWPIHIFRFGSEQKPWNVILRLRDNHLDRAQRSLTSRKDIFCQNI